MEGTSDAELLSACLAGSAAAGRELVDRHWQSLYRFCRRLGAAPELAEDLVQEAFARLWYSSSGWQPERGQMNTWLYRVATNLYRDDWRRVQRHARVVDDEALSAVPFETTYGTTGEQTGTDSRYQQLQRALARLPESHRTALLLRYFEGLSNRQTADVLGVSIMALESVLARARRTLIAELSGA